MIKLISFFSILWILFTISTQAQTIAIKGKVTDSSGSALAGASVICKNTTTGAITDLNGMFSITCFLGKDTLVVSFIGFITEVIPVNGRTYLEVQLIADVKRLDEIVVIGYSSVKKSCVTGAISSVHSSDRPGVSAQDKIIYNGPTIGPGILTAGEINDFCKWNLWNDISNNELKEYQKTWEIRPLERYTLQFQTEQGKPIVDAQVKLMNNKTIVWESRTDNTGKAELWANAFDLSKTEKLKYSIEINYKGSAYNLNKISAFHKGINIIKAPVTCDFSNTVDIAFVVDATGSMGDEINYLKAELNDIIGKIKDTLPILNIRLASVFYRDEGDAYITKKSNFSSDITQTVDFIKANEAGGGGDEPEAVDQALKVTLDSLIWSDNALCRIAFLILDAPPHENPKVKESLKILIKSYAAKGIKLIPITCSGINKGTEYLMRSFALLTNGTYLFLTDHSGVGDVHLKPTTDKYDVELLNKLIQRIIIQSAYTPGCGNTVEPLVTDTVKIYHTKAIEVPLDFTMQDTIKSKATSDKVINKPEQSWKFYPNPTHGNITIEMDGEFGEIFVADLRGKILERLKVNNSESMEIDISKYPTGMYLLRYEYKPGKWLDGKVILVH